MQRQSLPDWPFTNSRGGFVICRLITTPSSIFSLVKSPFQQRVQLQENPVNQPFADAVGYLLWLGVICFTVSIVGGGGWAPIMGFVAAAPVVLIVAGFFDRLG